MKKWILCPALLCVTAALCLLLAGCSRSLSPVGTWTLEAAADGAGHAVIPCPQITCTVSREGTLTLSGDRNTAGSYTAQALGDGTLYLEGTTEDGVRWIGTCGIRTYADGSETLVLILSNEDGMLSFLPA